MTHTKRERWRAERMRQLTLGLWITATALGTLVLVLEVLG